VVRREQNTLGLLQQSQEHDMSLTDKSSPKALRADLLDFKLLASTAQSDRHA